MKRVISLEFLSSIPGPWLAFLGTLFGGTGLKVLEHFLGKNKVRVDVATQLRDEMRKDIRELQTRVDELEAETDKWRARAWKAEDELARKRAIMISHGCMPNENGSSTS